MLVRWRNRCARREPRVSAHGRIVGGARSSLCLPVVDAFEVDPDCVATHYLSGYRQRARALADSLWLKAENSPELRHAGAALVVDDVVTYGSTFEACAVKLRERYPQLRVYGAALAYTETPSRRAAAESERHATL